MRAMCSCPHGPPHCKMVADTACPLCEDPFCAPCLVAHHDCSAEPQHIHVPERKHEEVAS